MSGEKTGGAEMGEFSCLLPRDDGYLGLGQSSFTPLEHLISTITASSEI